MKKAHVPFWNIWVMMENNITKQNIIILIISIGFRVNSKTAIKFRTWANKLIKDYIVKGFNLNDDRFIKGNKFDKKHFNEYADLIALYVDPKYQGLGIGSSFKNIFENWAIEHGATQYVIGVLKDNMKARQVYELWGEKLSEFEEDFVKLGIGYPEVFYTYNLQKELKKHI